MTKFKVAAIILTFLLIISGCSKSEKNFNTESFITDMLASGAFTDELTLAENSIGCYLYGLSESDAESMTYYFSSGATAEEMVVFKAKDNDGIKKLTDAVNMRVDYQKSAFKSYVPAEVPKLEKAVISVSGLYVVLYVTADYDAAKKAADKYLES